MKRALDLSGRSPATLGLCCAGIKFYFRTVLDRNWKLFSILHTEDQRTPRWFSPRRRSPGFSRARLETTMRYLHLTGKGQADACRIINSVIGEVGHVRHR